MFTRIDQMVTWVRTWPEEMCRVRTWRQWFRSVLLGRRGRFAHIQENWWQCIQPQDL